MIDYLLPALIVTFLLVTFILFRFTHKRYTEIMTTEKERTILGGNSDYWRILVLISLGITAALHFTIFLITDLIF